MFAKMLSDPSFDRLEEAAAAFDAEQFDDARPWYATFAEANSAAKRLAVLGERVVLRRSADGYELEVA